MAAELEGKSIPDGNPNQCADKTKARIQFDYDAYAEVERWWMNGGRERIEAKPSLAGVAAAIVAAIPFLRRWWRRAHCEQQQPPTPFRPSVCSFPVPRVHIIISANLGFMVPLSIPRLAVSVVIVCL